VGQSRVGGQCIEEYHPLANESEACKGRHGEGFARQRIFSRSARVNEKVVKELHARQVVGGRTRLKEFSELS